ncbi:glycoside hydrolase family 32 protein [Paenibacillus qinlingensis]|uniref:beta-fructofuranosidase n=1 Tax=Paenibacillus qinlingensis TaxID=1837343 RepID=A0ABU1NT00_9BACL|nr:glycoside hydrolase family 32 protein [Paenibacillus qinlingensis]MDR6550614.1 beta-fructofuranosidase [Paenibacillus qinlingensis]
MNLYRPIYHFLPENNWMNDPNGLLYVNQEYHLFYQYNPYADHWDTMHWGHAKSKDLVHWEHLAIALTPSHELGELHCFSGCAVDHDGVPTILYTSIGAGERSATDGPEQWLATSRDGMLSWEKYRANPVLSLKAHGDMQIKEWRDPFVWKEGDVWYMVVGGIHEDKGCALIYSSSDLTEWQFLNKLDEGTEGIWECPNFFKLGNKYVLIYSPAGQVKYAIGTWNSDYSFTSEIRGVMDCSGSDGFYAPNSMIGPDSRRLLWGWIPEAARGEFKGNAGWAGMQSIPRVLTLAPDETLRMEPAVELQILRRNEYRLDNKRILSGNEPLEIHGRALEMTALFHMEADAQPFGIKLLRSPKGEEETVLIFEPEKGKVSIDRLRSSLSEQPDKSRVSGTLDFTANHDVKVQLFLDHSVLEVFINDTQCLTARIYPTLVSSDGVSLFALGKEDVLLQTFCVWEMASIWS